MGRRLVPGADISTTARQLARPQARVPHRLDRAVLERDFRCRRSRTSGYCDAAVAEHLVRADDVLSSSLPRHSIRRHSTRGISRDIRRAFGKMAASTRTQRSGLRSPSQRSAMATRRSNFCRCAIPSIGQRRGRRLGATGLSLTLWRPTSTVSRHTSGVADGRGTRDQPPGCIERLSSGSSGSTCKA